MDDHHDADNIGGRFGRGNRSSNRPAGAGISCGSEQGQQPVLELPQPKSQEILTALPNKTPVDMSGVTTVEKRIIQDGHTVRLYIMTPEHVAGKPGVLLFIPATDASVDTASNREFGTGRFLARG
jgi:hypothetical protein